MVLYFTTMAKIVAMPQIQGALGHSFQEKHSVRLFQCWFLGIWPIKIPIGI
jgi:hypothetical protein